jgi:hypothetical protein
MAKAGVTLVRQMGEWGRLSNSRFVGDENALASIENLYRGDPLVSRERIADLDQWAIRSEVRKWSEKKWRDEIRRRMREFEPRHPTKSQERQRKAREWETGEDIAHFPADLREELMAQRRGKKNPYL